MFPQICHKTTKIAGKLFKSCVKYDIVIQFIVKVLPFGPNIFYTLVALHKKVSHLAENAPFKTKFEGNILRSEYMSRIPRHVSSRVYVSHSETCKQPSVDLVHISVGGKRTKPETLTRKFFQLLKQRSK